MENTKVGKRETKKKMIKKGKDRGIGIGICQLVFC